VTVLKLFFHDACFDGTASAALFASFWRDRHPAPRVVPVAMQHAVGDPFAGVAIDGDDNACVDFRYSAHPAMRWWFDHHRTAFQPPSLAADFEARVGPTRAFDPDAPSCAGLVARTLAERYQWTAPTHLDELVRWADVIDAAAYGSAAAACALTTPAQRLAMWIGHHRDPAVLARYIDALTTTPLDQLVAAPWIEAELTPLVARRARDREAWARLGQRIDDLVVFDLIDSGLPPPGFSGYDLFPDCTYTVTLARTPSAVKIGVGFNPWGTHPRRHDVGALCASHGGGGHAAVGGVTLPPDAIERGRIATAAIVTTLTAAR